MAVTQAVRSTTSRPKTRSDNSNRSFTPKTGVTRLMLRTKIKSLFELNARLKRIRRSDLPQSMHQELARAALRLSAPNRFALPNPIRLMGYKVSYFRAWELRFLFH